MDTVLSPLTILFTNLLAALMLAIVKDVVNNVWWGETQLVLQKLSIPSLPERPEAEAPHVEITGRRAGLIGYLLTLFEFSPTVSLTANSQEVRKSSTSLNGHSLELIPLSDNVSVQADSQRSLVWLAAALSSLTAGVASALVLGDRFIQQILDAIAWLLVAGVYLFAYYQSHRFQIVVHGAQRTGISFKPGVLEGRAIHFEDLERTAEALMERIQASRGLASAAREEVKAPISPVFTPSSLPPLPFIAPAVAQHFDSDETVSEPVFPPRATPEKKAQVPDRSNTGTVEYGEDQPAFEESASYWSDGLEPGTSDSIQLRQSLTRSVTSLSLGASGNLSEYEDADLDDRDTDSNIGAHRGTVSWEEHADKTQDEMRAEAELADLKRSRPKRGEARLRLRELMRRFPQTEAANKARRMLERLEAGG